MQRHRSGTCCCEHATRASASVHASVYVKKRRARVCSAATREPWVPCRQGKVQENSECTAASLHRSLVQQMTTGLYLAYQACMQRAAQHATAHWQDAVQADAQSDPMHKEAARTQHISFPCMHERLGRRCKTCTAPQRNTACKGKPGSRSATARGACRPADVGVCDLCLGACAVPAFAGALACRLWVVAGAASIGRRQCQLAPPAGIKWNTSSRVSAHIL